MLHTMSEGRVVLVTGAARGIGRGIALSFLEAGHRVMAADLGEGAEWRYSLSTSAELDATVDELSAYGDISATSVDVTNADSCRSAVKATMDTFGRLGVLVNNAGISPKGPNGERLNTLDTDLMSWGQVFHVNFFASVVLARGLKDELAAAKGSVVNVTSIAGARVHPFAGAAYATSKAALAALTREMAHDFGPMGVRVNAIAPGEVETSILSEGTDKIVAKLPLRRLGQPEEVAAAIYFLCSDASSYISGPEIEVNGAQHV
jgi:NAD(P)-dependent dehydrogenase (short-subunit alcohol dehydrogenase family)